MAYVRSLLFAQIKISNILNHTYTNEPICISTQNLIQTVAPNTYTVHTYRLQLSLFSDNILYKKKIR